MSRAATTPDKRKREIAAIHVARTQLQLDDDAYRDVIERVSRESGCRKPTRSSAKLDDKQRHAVLDEFRRLGAGQRVRTSRGTAQPGQYPGRPANFNQMPAMIDKIEAQLADMGLAWRYADSIAKRMFGIPMVAWVRKEEQLRAILAALDVEQKKRDLSAAVDRLCAELHVGEAELVRLTAKAPKNWRRNLRFLNALVEHLAARRLQLEQLEAPCA